MQCIKHKSGEEFAYFVCQLQTCARTIYRNSRTWSQKIYLLSPAKVFDFKWKLVRRDKRTKELGAISLQSVCHRLQGKSLEIQKDMKYLSHYAQPFGCCCQNSWCFLPEKVLFDKDLFSVFTKSKVADPGRRKLVLCHRGATQMNYIVITYVIHHGCLSCVLTNVTWHTHQSGVKKACCHFVFRCKTHWAGTNHMSSVISQPALVFKAEW